MRVARVLLVVGCICGLSSTACGDGEEGMYREPVEVTGDPVVPRGAPPYFPDARPAPPNDLDWGRCPLFSDGLDEGAECATVEVPVEWAEPGGETIELFVKRYRATSTPRGQLWLLAGGPGGSGAEFDSQVFDDPREDVYPSFGEMAPDLEIYLLDHRGTGRSSRLGCAVAEAPDSESGSQIGDEEWQDCRDEVEAEWGALLRGFTITEAAADLGYLIERTRHGDEPVFVYGVSYGTLWAQRYLHLHPDQATGVVLDSICSPGACELSLGFDAGFDEVGNAILDLCAEDPACAGRFEGDDPAEALDAVLAAAEAGDCAGLEIEPSEVRFTLGLLLRSWPLRDLVPATIARLRACDGEAIARLFALLAPTEDTPADELFSSVLNRHIGLSELFRAPPPSLEEAEAHTETLRFSLDVGPDLVALLETGWPTYEPDELTGRFPETSVPILMMNGTLDPQTPLTVANAAGAHFDGPHQTYVVVPYATHSVVNQSPIDYAADGTLVTCGQLLFEQFVAAPREALDVNCTDEVIEPDFLNTALAELVLGTPRPYAEKSTGDPSSKTTRAALPRGIRRFLGRAGF